MQYATVVTFVFHTVIKMSKNKKHAKTKTIVWLIFHVQIIYFHEIYEAKCHSWNISAFFFLSRTRTSLFCEVNGLRKSLNDNVYHSDSLLWLKIKCFNISKSRYGLDKEKSYQMIILVLICQSRIMAKIVSCKINSWPYSSSKLQLPMNDVWNNIYDVYTCNIFQTM